MGVMLAEPGFHTRCFVEWEQYPQQCLIAAQRAGYFAPAPIWDDATTFDGKPWRGHIDLLTAGYPCQPFSHAGQRKGASDERHLWPDVARIIDECAPELVFLENVEGHISLGLDTVLLDLERLGYRHACGLFSTAETRGTQGRKRVFILARRKGFERGREQPTGKAGRGWAGSSRGCADVADNDQHDARAEREQCGGEFRRDQSNGGDGQSSLDSGPSPRRDGAGERAGPNQQGGECLSREGCEDVGSASRKRGSARHPNPATGNDRHAGKSFNAGRSALPHSPPGPEDYNAWGRVLNVAPHLAPALSVSDVKRIANHCAALVAEGCMAEAEAESHIRILAHALESRPRALRVLGNGVDPVTAAYAWRSLGLALGLRPVDLGGI